MDRRCCGCSTWPTREAQRDFAGEVRDWAPRPIGAVFNNAGVATASSVLDAVPEDDQWLWNINFHGVVNGTRAFLPILVEQDEGAIVNTSSVFGLVGMPNQSAYCSAKFAVRGFTDSLRQELRGTGVDRDQRSPRRHQHQHRAQRPVAQGSRGPRPQPGPDGAGVRRHHADAAGQGRRDHPPRSGAGQGAHPRRTRRLPVRHARRASRRRATTTCWDASSRSCADAARRTAAAEVTVS